MRLRFSISIISKASLDQVGNRFDDVVPFDRVVHTFAYNNREFSGHRIGLSTTVYEADGCSAVNLSYGSWQHTVGPTN